MGRAVLPSPSRSGQAQDLLCGGGSLIFGAMLASLLADSKPVVIGANKVLKQFSPVARRSQATVGLRPSQVQTAPRATIPIRSGTTSARLRTARRALNQLEASEEPLA